MLYIVVYGSHDRFILNKMCMYYTCTYWYDNDKNNKYGSIGHLLYQYTSIPVHFDEATNDEWTTNFE